MVSAPGVIFPVYKWLCKVCDEKSIRHYSTPDQASDELASHIWRNHGNSRNDRIPTDGSAAAKRQ